MPQTETSSVITAGNVVARRYGGALFELAEEQDQLDAVAGDLRLLKILARDNTDFKQLANHPRLARADLVEVMKQIGKAGKLHALTGNFLMLVADSRRLACLGAMADAFLAQLATHRGELIADIRVAHALTEAQSEKLAVQLRQLAASSKVQLAVKVDPALLGGMTVKLGSHLIDASVKTKLARLERRLKSQEEAA